MTTPVTVVLADDHPMFRFGLNAALAGSADVEVLAQASDGTQLINAVELLHPDVVITDLAMPGVDGSTATHDILTKFPATGVLVLTMHDDDANLTAALRAGAHGYLLKGADRDEIIRAILAVAAGGAVYSATIGRRIVDAFTRTSVHDAAQPFPQLTAREREILELVAAGLGNHQIAKRLVLSEKTVRNNVATIIGKIHARDRAAAVSKARDAGLGPPNTTPQGPSAANEA